jgi:hypothetical protein
MLLAAYSPGGPLGGLVFDFGSAAAGASEGPLDEVVLLLPLMDR